MQTFSARRKTRLLCHKTLSHMPARLMIWVDTRGPPQGKASCQVAQSLSAAIHTAAERVPGWRGQCIPVLAAVAHTAMQSVMHIYRNGEAAYFELSSYLPFEACMLHTRRAVNCCKIQVSDCQEAVRHRALLASTVCSSVEHEFLQHLSHKDQLVRCSTEA